MGKMQKVKGSRFQNWVNDYFQAEFHEIVVTNPKQTGDDAGRDHLTALPFCIQTAHREHINVWEKLQEALRSARAGELSLAVLKKNYKKPIVVMTLEEWTILAKAALRNG